LISAGDVAERRAFCSAEGERSWEGSAVAMVRPERGGEVQGIWSQEGSAGRRRRLKHGWWMVGKVAGRKRFAGSRQVVVWSYVVGWRKVVWRRRGWDGHSSDVCAFEMAVVVIEDL
jgi:hypothetical protein